MSSWNQTKNCCVCLFTPPNEQVAPLQTLHVCTCKHAFRRQTKQYEIKSNAMRSQELLVFLNRSCLPTAWCNQLLYVKVYLWVKSSQFFFCWHPSRKVFSDRAGQHYTPYYCTETQHSPTTKHLATAPRRNSPSNRKKPRVQPAVSAARLHKQQYCDEAVC